MGLRENIFKETVDQLAVRQPIVTPPGTPVREAAARMRQKQIGCVFVVDDDGKPIGKFTQRQLIKLLLNDPAKLDGRIDAVMYPDADAVRVDEPIATVIKTMSSRQVRYIAVVDERGRVVGLTGQRGVMEYIADSFPRQIKSQRMKPLVSMSHREGA